MELIVSKVLLKALQMPGPYRARQADILYQGEVQNDTQGQAKTVTEKLEKENGKIYPPHKCPFSVIYYSKIDNTISFKDQFDG